MYGLAWAIGKLANVSKGLRTGLIATSMFPNNGNMGLPVVSFALGTAGLERAIVYMIGSSILMFCGGPAILQGKGIIFGLRLIVKLPLLWAILAGLSLRIFSIKLPFQIDTGIEKLGQAAIPVALIVLGMQLADTAFELRLREMLAALVRLLVAPLLAYLIGLGLHLEGLDLQVLVLQSAMPTAVNSFILVSEFGGDTAFVARTILTTTLMSFMTLPLIIWLFSSF
jgi:predicted permease